VSRDAGETGEPGSAPERKAALFSILQRTILFELVRVFLLALVAVMGIMVMGGIVAEATQQGLSPLQLLAAIPMLIPSFLPYTIPATTLFATCVVYGRLAHDNEILAIQSSGIHLRQAITPAVILGVVMSATTMALYYELIPYTHQMLRTAFLNDAEEYLYAMLKKDRSIKMLNTPYCIFVRHVQGRRLEEAIFKRREAHGEKYDIIARANEAELHVDLPNKEVQVHMHHCRMLDDNGKARSYLQNKTFHVPLPPSFGERKEPRPRGMSYPALLEHRQKLLEVMEEMAATIAVNVAQLAVVHPPTTLPEHIANLKSARRQRQAELNSVDTELWMRPALSFGCLCFVLVSCPVGIWFSRSDFLSAFITCFLPIVFIYYPILLSTTNYARQGKVHPALALSAANALMVLIAAVLFRRLLRH
jgi:lipopolysaccharide export system permease protein